MTRLNVVPIPPIPAPKADPLRAREDATIKRALSILSSRMRQPGHLLNSPKTTCNYVRLVTGGLEHEVFIVMYLDPKHRVIGRETMFRGTLTQTSVHPREVVKAALAHNACAVIVAHNHPSGEVEPSEADKVLTRALSSALALIDVRVLDHIVVTARDSYSFAEHGLI